MRAGMLRFGQEFKQWHKGLRPCIYSCFLQVMYFFTSLCWINKMCWRFGNDWVRTIPWCQPRLSLRGPAAVGREGPGPRSALCPTASSAAAGKCCQEPQGPTEAKASVQGRQLDRLPAGSGQPSSLAGAPVRALLVPVSIRQMLVHAMLCTSCLPEF